MYEEKYETLVDLVRQEKDWAVYNSIVDLKLEDRVFLLQSNFLQAADQHDDEKAPVYWEFLNRCLRDIELIPFLRMEKFLGTCLLRDEKTREAQSRAQANCAAKAKELWQKIPRSRIEKDRRYLGGSLADAELPTLLETKKVLLGEIATRWRDTKNEQEAFELFEFFMFLKLQLGENRLLLDAVRKATDSYFPATRLSRCLVRLEFSIEGGLIGSDFRREFEKILAIAWARNTKFKEIARLVKAMIPILGASDGAFDLLERQANKYAILDQAVSKLLKSMNGQVRVEGLDHIFGDKVVSYPGFHVPDENHVEIVIIDRKEPYLRSFYSENAGHSSFEAARKHVDCWLKEYSGYSVHLKFMVVDKYDPKNCFFSREQTIKIR